MGDRKLPCLRALPSKVPWARKCILILLSNEVKASPKREISETWSKCDWAGKKGTGSRKLNVFHLSSFL